MVRSTRTTQRLLAVITVIVALGVIAVEVAAPRTEKRSFDLTARDAGRVFTIPESMWSSINRFVFLIGFDFDEKNTPPGPSPHVEFATRFSKLAVYPELHTACRVWGHETFATLQTLATALAGGDIKERLSSLQATVHHLRADPHGAQSAFEQQAESLNRRLTELSELSGRVQQQFITFSNLSTAAIREYTQHNFPESRWVSIGPQLEEVQRTVGAMLGRWQALTSDVHDLRTLVATRLAANRPVADDLDIEIGLTTWDDIVRDAQMFMTNVPGQRKYLSGENYYEECPLREDAWYVMKNQFLAGKDDVLTLAESETTGLLKMLPRSPDNPIQEWQFRRLGRGWWSIINRKYGNSHLLIVYSAVNGEGLRWPPRIAPNTGMFIGQWWRCLPTEEAGWFRLFNAFEGELRSLDTEPWPPDDKTHTAFMKPTENRRGQYWQFQAGG